MMKSNWNSIALEELCHIFNGLWKGIKPPFINVNVIRNTNFSKEGLLDDSNIANLPVEISTYKKRKLEFGDIILEKSGGGPNQPVGRVVFFNKKKGEFSFSNFTSTIRVLDKNLVDPEYLHKYLHFIYLSGRTEPMQRRAVGIRNLQLKEYRQLLVPIPPLVEQHRIVKILNEAFAGLEVVKKNTEKNLVNAKELFDSYLQNIFANPGDDWEEKNIGQILKLEYGKPLPKSERVSDGEYGVFGANGIKTRSNKFYFKKASIIVGRKGSAGELTLVNRPFWPLDVTYFVTTNESHYDIKFLYYLLLNLGLPRLARGVKPGINRNDVYSMQVCIPSISTQKQIVDQLDLISNKSLELTATYEQKMNNLDELKKSFLQKAFAGEL